MNLAFALSLNMRKIFAAGFLLMLAFSARGQSVSAKDLIRMLDNSDKVGFLKGRSFSLILSDIDEKGLTQSFVKGGGTPQRESVFITAKTVSYMTRSKAYIDNLLNQLKKQYKQTGSDEGSDF